MKFKFLNKSLFLEVNKEKVKKILVIGDLHIGYEEALNESGIFLPRMQFKDTLKDLKEIFKKLKRDLKRGKLDEIVILGDLKHEFGRISKQEWKETEEILDFLKKKSKKIVLIKGNHDIILEPIAKRKELEIKKHYIVNSKQGDICFLHGDKLLSECLDKKIKFLIIGHRHPAVVLHDKYKKEKYKCFLVGKWKKKKIFILPSFFPFIEGGDIINSFEEHRLFIPEKTLKKFDVYVVSSEGKIYRFGKLKSII